MLEAVRNQDYLIVYLWIGNLNQKVAYAPSFGVSSERVKQFSEFLDIRDIDTAIQKTSIFNLSTGKKQRYEYGIYIMLMKKRKLKVLLSL